MATCTTDSRCYREGYRPMQEKHRKVMEEEERWTGKPLDVLDDASYGCVPLRILEDGSIRVLVVQQKTAHELYWTFPSGHPDEGESEVDAALRETREEAGLRLNSSQVRPSIYGDIKYSFVHRMHSDRWAKHKDYGDDSKRPKLIFHKLVRFFLAVVEDPELSPNAEIAAAEWLEVEEAKHRLATSPSDVKGILEEVLRSDVVARLVEGRRH